MRADETRSIAPTRHGAYVCLTRDAVQRLAPTAVPDVADRLGLANEFFNNGFDPPQAIAYLRRVAVRATSADPRLEQAAAVVHVAAPEDETVKEFCAEFGRLLGPEHEPAVLAGVVRPMTYTSNAMFDFAYAHRVLPQPGTVLPNAFLVPVRKSSDWWAQDWMRRHTYFLPRYDDSGRMVNEGHALAAAAGVDCLMRRTYRHAEEPAPAGEYDFVSYFECADESIPVFDQVCDALRDVQRNPEWTFVEEGPTWHGRRVASWGELLD
jgi:hypothetical protein